MDIEELFTEEVLNNIREDIRGSSNQEIYLIGKLDIHSCKVVDYNLLARGNSSMVPAIITDLKPGNVIIHNHPSGDLRPSAADIRLASRTGNNGVGFAIINNRVDRVYVVVEPKMPEEEILLTPEEIITLFQKEGKLAQHLQGFEYREQQVAVVREVINSFNQHQFNFIEAGTGTGKSFAYLIPALYWSKLNNQVVVVSTNTINLQEQLIEKDLVFLKKVLPFSYKAVLVKGRRNYICKRKLKNLEKRAQEAFIDEPEKEMEFVKVLNWLEQTETGTYSDLSFVIKTDLWDELASESDLCLRTNCPYFDSCFFMLARKEVYSADLLIVNHHLLISDALIKAESKEKDAAVLPKYKNLIIDEAHNFVDSSTSHLGRSFYYHLLHKYLERLAENQFSLLPRLRNRLGEFELQNKQDILSIFDHKLFPQIKRITDKSGDYFKKLKDLFKDQGEDVIRLTREKLNSGDWIEVQNLGEDLLGHLNNLGVYLNDLYEELLNLPDSIVAEFEEMLLELESSLLRCQQIISNLAFNLETGDEDYVFWLEKGKGSLISQENAPLDISGILNDILWSFLDNLILTSATLTVNKRFNFFQELLGLEKSRCLQVESPFNYREQAELIIPENIPPANSSNFLEEIIDDLREILVSFGGRTMVLFTSYGMLNYCVQKTGAVLRREGINLLPQGKYPRNYIIDNFKKNERQIIFGTVSFWEGVDIKGDNLQYLIIMKLPFPVPSEPVAAARMEQLKKEGKNPFYDYSLPRAVIRFKQGFGRLIRSRQDKGIVITFDNRLLTKSYGRVFLNSLPAGCPVQRVDIKSVSSRGKIR
ncbi:MAG: ATP-dependent helicase DinG [Halanaerobiales bacterium]|nr:ATP-dependent helicase DinG [Halanaerobiales bacterium]